MSAAPANASVHTVLSETEVRARRRNFVVAGLVALVVLTTCAATLGAIIRSLRFQLTKLPINPESGLKFHTLPEEFPGWRMVTNDVMSAEGMAELGTDNYVSRWYKQVGPDGEDTGVVVQLHCAYYTGMIDTVPHVPERCMVGGGMEYAGQTQVMKVPLNLARLTPDPDMPDDPRGTILMGRNNRTNSRVRLPFGVQNLEMMVTPFRDQSAKSTLYAGYFFVANGGVVASANDVRLLAFKLSDDYAYYAKVQFLSPSVDSAEGLAALAASMLDEIFPDLMVRVPDWVSVEEGRYPPDNPRRNRPIASADPQAR